MVALGKNGKVPATTLVETLAAMTLIMISFGIGMMIYLNILTSNHLERRAQAHLHLQQFLAETKQGQLFFDEEQTVGGYVLVRTVNPYGAYGEAFLVELSAIDIDGQVLQELKEIVYVGPQKQ